MERLMRVLGIKPEEAHPWLLHKHYARRIPMIIYAFGLYDDTQLIGVVTFGLPPSAPLCRGICGQQWANNVLELNRLCLADNKKNQSSFLVAGAMRLLPKPSIVVSYADDAQGHVGYVYQATNFLYTGAVKAHDDEYMVYGKKTHARTLTGRGITNPKEWAKENNVEIVKAKPKHRYVYFVGNKHQKKQMLNALNYPQMPYPKGDTKRYDAGSNVETQTLLFI
jgi:hypothetical protein